jgi:hypothetical protein
MANYMFEFSFFYRISHLEGEEVFGSAKWPADCPLGADNDSHCLNHVKISCPWIIIHIVQPNVVENVGM